MQSARQTQTDAMSPSSASTSPTPSSELTRGFKEVSATLITAVIGRSVGAEEIVNKAGNAEMGTLVASLVGTVLAKPEVTEKYSTAVIKHAVVEQLQEDQAEALAIVDSTAVKGGKRRAFTQGYAQAAATLSTVSSTLPEAKDEQKCTRLRAKAAIATELRESLLPKDAAIALIEKAWSLDEDTLRQNLTAAVHKLIVDGTIPLKRVERALCRQFAQECANREELMAAVVTNMGQRESALLYLSPWQESASQAPFSEAQAILLPGLVEAEAGSLKIAISFSRMLTKFPADEPKRQFLLEAIDTHFENLSSKRKERAGGKSADLEAKLSAFFGRDLARIEITFKSAFNSNSWNFSPEKMGERISSLTKISLTPQSKAARSAPEKKARAVYERENREFVRKLMRLYEQRLNEESTLSMATLERPPEIPQKVDLSKALTALFNDLEVEPSTDKIDSFVAGHPDTDAVRGDTEASRWLSRARDYCTAMEQKYLDESSGALLSRTPGSARIMSPLEREIARTEEQLLRNNDGLINTLVMRYLEDAKLNRGAVQQLLFDDLKNFAREGILKLIKGCPLRYTLDQETGRYREPEGKSHFDPDGPAKFSTWAGNGIKWSDGIRSPEARRLVARHCATAANIIEVANPQTEKFPMYRTQEGKLVREQGDPLVQLSTWSLDAPVNWSARHKLADAKDGHTIPLIDAAVVADLAEHFSHQPESPFAFTEREARLRDVMRVIFERFDGPKSFALSSEEADEMVSVQRETLRKNHIQEYGSDEGFDADGAEITRPWVPGEMPVELDHQLNKPLKAIFLRYGLGGGTQLTLSGVADYLGVTPERIRQILSRALRRLRQPDYSSQLGDYMR